MLRDNYLKDGDKHFKEFQDDENEPAIQRSINITKLRVMKQEKLRRWSQQIDIFA